MKSYRRSQQSAEYCTWRL